LPDQERLGYRYLVTGGQNSGVGARGATVMISVTVREGHENDYRRWQQRMDQIAGSFAGFEATEVYPPSSGENRVWTVLFRFTTIDQLRTWLNSAERQRLLDEGQHLFDRPATQEVLAGEPPKQDVVTAVVSHSVRPGRERDFAHWQDKARRLQEKSPGFMGFELFEPVPGIQDRWVAVFRYDTREHLDEWLASEARAKLLEEGREYFAEYDLRQIGSAFSGWFRFGGAVAGAPSNWKQGLSVLLALYPTVSVLNLTVGHQLQALRMPAFLALFIGNTLSVGILTWVLMPLVNRVFAFWLRPAKARSIGTNVTGAAVIVACYLVFLAIFWWIGVGT
jgi:uncharacterized protein